MDLPKPPSGFKILDGLDKRVSTQHSKIPNVVVLINWFVIRFFSILGITHLLSLSLSFMIYLDGKRGRRIERSRWKVVGEVHGERVERRWLEIRLTSPATSQGEMVLLTYRTWALDLPLYSIRPMRIFSKLDLTVGGFHENPKKKKKTNNFS